MDRLHTRLARFEDAFPGFLTEIVEGSVVATPVTPYHGSTTQRVWTALEQQLAPGWGLVSRAAFPFDDGNEFCPDLAVIPERDIARNDLAYPPHVIALVAEVVARGSVRRDYEIKPQMYASRGIANHLLFDPLQGHAVTMWNPGPDGYRGRDTVPYGPDLVVDTPLGKLTIPTHALPVDPKAPGR
ncbi:Uma2 family endonuclease [Streptomyces niveiscabiei]|uniref:Uma2 family endonuclease n=1 Tax=Streptomyces niveiscabiei TaxID=164115 RepID=UPI0029B8242B|nr:Uma2 family endonuclease [Streptomyces niveiscabiei]MDX3383624.1 Uma2 family endonuclease [Streptomyces niveiscabiei]